MVPQSQLIETTKGIAYSSRTVVACYTDRNGRSGSYADPPKHSWAASDTVGEKIPFEDPIVPHNRSFPALAKVRLAHGLGHSFLLVDHVFLKESNRWLQPKNFVLCHILFEDDKARTKVVLELKDGTTVQVNFWEPPRPQQLRDRSWLYPAMVIGPDNLDVHSAGTWRMGSTGVPQLRLFHHTHEEAAASIRSSQEFWSSAWNFQGTRKLTNISYVYFTDLESIQSDQDLADIAMSPKRKLYFIRDGAQAPQALPPHWRATPLAKDVLELEVYWSSPEKRDQVIEIFVDADLLSPTHMLRHEAVPVWREMILPSVYRVGVEPGTTIRFSEDQLKEPVHPKRFDYHVIGDATSLEGLAAPFDEENTSQIFKVQGGDIPPLAFWKANANTDQYSGNETSLQEFEAGT
ncbi:MAG: hypothetical protein KIS97_03600 [Nitrospira sp.]|nr:hypothetical protein [Nitrospira sp.]